MALSVKRNFLFSSSELSPSLLVCPIVRLFAAQTALLNFCLQRISSSHLFLLRPHFYLIYLSFYKKSPHLYFFGLESNNPSHPKEVLHREISSSTFIH